MKSTTNFLKSLLLIFSIGIFLSGISQNSNKLEVARFLNPSLALDYDSSDQIEISLVLLNKGPNDIPQNDLIKFEYNVAYFQYKAVISNGDTTFQIEDTTESYLVNVPARRRVRVGEEESYVLTSSYTLPISGTFGISARANGTSFFPINNAKNPSNSIQFTVSLEEEKSLINKVYFAQNTITVQLNQSFRGQLQIFDLSGKLLKHQSLSNNQRQSIPFNSQPRGVYFLKVISEEGKSDISKFIKTSK